MRPYWMLRVELAIIDGVAMKDKWFIIPAEIQCQALQQLQSNSMGIGNTGLLAQESIHQITLNTNTECNKTVNMPWMSTDAFQRQSYHP